VLERSDDDGIAEKQVPEPPTAAEVATLLQSLVAARNADNSDAVAGFYTDDARILFWRGSSSWLKTPEVWSRDLVESEETITLRSHWVLTLGLHTRAIATFEGKDDEHHYLSLHSFEFRKTKGQWQIAGEGAIDRLDLTRHPLSGYSIPVLADLSYRKEPELAFLRYEGESSTTPELAWKDLEGKECPPQTCKAELRVKLLTASLAGDVLVNTHLRTYRDSCAQIPRARLRGSIRVYEREALILEEREPRCHGDNGTWGRISVIGVRNTETNTLMAMERSRVISVDKAQIFIEHSAKTGAKPQVVRLIPGKQEDKLVFRAEPADAPSTVTGPPL
jgi:hypothetical protein